MSKPETDDYRSFLLRCWCEQPATAEQPAVWRFMLQGVGQPQEQHVFATLEQMVVFLRRKMIEEGAEAEED